MNHLESCSEPTDILFRPSGCTSCLAPKYLSLDGFNEINVKKKKIEFLHIFS